MDFKPIETYYKGRRFRSRLEARWAVFFDALGIKWEYEAEGYHLPDGSMYLPDFWLPTFGGGMYAEVKPDGGDFTKAKALAEASWRPVWCCEGTPDIRCYGVYEYVQCGDNPLEVVLIPSIPLADQAEGENRMYSQPGYENDDGTISPTYYDNLGFTFLHAVELARAARFEFGESGGP